MRPKLRELRATYRVTTPMFLGDADQQAPTHIRPPSVRGALRWWWRASMWPDIRLSKRDDASALRALHEQEAEVWGAASKRVDGKEVGGQGVILRVRMLTAPAKIESPRVGGGQGYLLGQGLYHFREGVLRKAIARDQRFEVRLIWRPQSNDELSPGLERALWLWGVLGGLGSRARRGLGSVAIESLQGGTHAVPENLDELQSTLRTMWDALPADEPPISAFCKRTRIRGEAHRDADGWTLLGRIGDEMQLDRSFGQNGRVGRSPGKPAEQNFKDDHDAILHATQGRQLEALPRRSVFGLPHNYFFSSGAKPKVDIAPAEKTRERRASPLLIHIHRFPDGTHAAIQTLLQAQFLPASDRVQGKGDATFTLPPRADWQVIHDYLDRFGGQELLP